MRHILSISLAFSILAFLAVGVGVFVWCVGVMGQPSILSANAPAPAPVADSIAAITDIEALRRVCLPIADFQDDLFQRTRAMASQTERVFSAIVLILVGVGTLLGLGFGFIYLTIRRLRARHPAIFE